VKLDDGREVLCTLALPLPLTLVGELGQAITDAAERVGYFDCSLLTDGSNRVVARPVSPVSPAADTEETAR
jgi:hypothetical protein